MTLKYLIDILLQFFEFGIFFYCMTVMMSYLVIGYLSSKQVKRYIKDRDATNYNSLLSSPLLPQIAIIAPAYNEQVTIVDNIRSLMSLHYSNLQVIVVNDGSKDNTLDAAIENYNLQKINYYYHNTIATKAVRGVYQSSNPAFKNLLVIDKENGGKADAINVGINIANAHYFACIDVDCIIEPDAFLKMVKPIMENHNKLMVAVGGIVWLTNESEIEQGQLLQIKSPDAFIPRMQVLEYFRAFLLGRTAWSRINGLLLISGAFGLFHRQTVLDVGGYNHKTVGEDMELVMRIHMHMHEKKIPYTVGYVPEPLCWTEAPANYTILGKQRHRWARGTVECLMIHKKMFFNPKYKTLGLISYPYWLFVEWMAPFAEAGGLLFVLVFALLGFINWSFFFLMIALVYVFAISISQFAILVQVQTYARYKTPKDLLKLIFTAFIEPIRYHPKTVYWSLKGNYDLMRGKNVGWGNMTRSGFNTSTPK